MLGYRATDSLKVDDCKVIENERFFFRPFRGAAPTSSNQQRLSHDSIAIKSVEETSLFNLKGYWKWKFFFRPFSWSNSYQQPLSYDSIAIKSVEETSLFNLKDWFWFFWIFLQSTLGKVQIFLSPRDLLHKTLMIYSYIIIFVSCLNSLTLPGLWSNPGVFKAAN